MRHIPSRKTLRSRFLEDLKKEPGDPEENIKKLRNLLTLWRDYKIKSREMLEEADKILGGFGVEYLESMEDDQYEAHGAYYVNTGDTYGTTLLLDLDRNRIWATSWGDWVEAEERQGKRFP